MKKTFAYKKLRRAGTLFVAVLGIVLIGFGTYFYIAFNRILIGDIDTDESLVLLSELDQKKLESVLEHNKKRQALPFPDPALPNPFNISDVHRQ